MIKSVIFDFDGTLMNTLPTISYFGNLALSSVGLDAIEPEKFRYFVGDGRDLLIHRMLEFHNADNYENYITVGKKYDEEYENNYLFKSIVYENIPELLSKLRKKGIKTAVLTNKPHNVAVQIINSVFVDMFDIYYGQRPGIPTKPSNDAALEIAEKLNANPEECAFVGDTAVDIQTGKNSGMYTIGVLWGFRDADELKNADIIVNHPLEIFDFVTNI